MTFSELLNEYICIFRCTAGELANASGLTQASLSRYRNGQRMPETDTLKKLASGIARIAAQNGTDLDLDLVFSQLAEAAGIVKTDHTQFSGQFSFLIDAISINLSELAKSMGYDPSYLSRIKKGQRMPADITKFAESLSAFLLRKYGGSEKMKLICKLIAAPQRIHSPIRISLLQ